MKYLTNLDLAHNQLLNVRLQQLASHPEGMKSGFVYFNTTDNKYYGYNGSAWKALDEKTVVEASTNGKIKVNGSDVTVYTHPAGTNPHGTTKADIGLGNVTNESKATMFTNPAFTGTPTAPTAAVGTNNTQIATTAFVKSQGYATLASPALSGTPTAPTASAGTNSTQIATTAFVKTAVDTATSGLASSLHEPVQDVTELKAIVAAKRQDKMMINVEDKGLYRYDAESKAASNDNGVIRPTDVASDEAAGRWIKMNASINDHNNLDALQGGSTGQYYHLTQAQHAQLHNRSHSMTSTSDHTATAWRVFYSNGSGQVTELPLGNAGQVLKSNGASSAPSWQNDNNTTYSVFGAASASAGGTNGLVPAPTSGKHTSFLRGDGQWVVPTDTNTASAVSNILAGSNSGTAITYAPYSAQQDKLSFDIGTTNPKRTDRLNLNGYLYATKLYSGGTEVEVKGHSHNYDNYNHFKLRGGTGSAADSAATTNITSGKTITVKGTGGTTVSHADGVITINSTNTTYGVFGGASSSAAGSQGLVKAPAQGDQNKVLRGNGNWDTVQNILGFTPPKKYSTTIGDATSTSYDVTHNLGTQDVVVTIREAASPFNVVMADVRVTDTNKIQVLFGSAPGASAYRVTVVG